MISLLTIAVLLFVFGLIAQEVAGRKPSDFDHHVILALRKSTREPVPIGPPWLQEAARDITSLGSVIVLLIITFAVAGFLLLTRKPGVAWLMLVAVLGGLALNNLLKYVFARTRPDFVPHSARVFTSSFPSGHATLSAITYLTIAALLARAYPSLMVNLYFISTRNSSNRAHRPKPNLSWCSFSNGYSRRLVHRRGLGHRLLGADDVASAWRPG